MPFIAARVDLEGILVNVFFMFLIVVVYPQKSTFLPLLDFYSFLFVKGK